MLLCEPVLLRPPGRGEVAFWVGEDPGARMRAQRLDDGQTSELDVIVTRLSRTAEDAWSRVRGSVARRTSGITPRPLWRFCASIDSEIDAVREDHAYRVGEEIDGVWVWGPWLQPAPAKPRQILLTSDHQLMPGTAAAASLMGQTAPDAIFYAGDMANVPDRASEWFDSTDGNAFLACLQGRACYVDGLGRRWSGSRLLQTTPIYPCLGNHEVMGARHAGRDLEEAFNDPTPRAGDSDDLLSWSTATFDELFELPWTSGTAGHHYSCRVGDVFLITLACTRAWRPTTADRDSRYRRGNSRYQDDHRVVAKGLTGGGSFIFEDLAPGSEQWRWLVEELGSEQRAASALTVVMLHEGPHGIGDNVMPPFAHPVEVMDGTSADPGRRYEYPPANNLLLNHLAPLLEDAGVELVFSGHNHVWNHFVSPRGTHYLESSLVGNTYGAFPQGGPTRRESPPLPWATSSSLPQGDPGALEPVGPSLLSGSPPFLASDHAAAWSVLDVDNRCVHTYYADLRDREPAIRHIDSFHLTTHKASIKSAQTHS